MKPHPEGPGGADPVDDLVARCLERAEVEGEFALDSLCDEHPQHADALRRRIAWLREVGMIGAFEAEPGASTEGASSFELLHREDSPGEAARPFGPYRISSLLGRGGQAEVYLAEDTRLGRNVALKLLRGAVLSNDAQRRFRREAELASRLDHPGICAVYDAGVHEGVPFIAMRHVKGESLAITIAAARSGKGQGRVSFVRLVARVARALHAAHEAGVVHRDIKPGNIMVTPEGDPVVLDFGLARDLEEDGPTLTRTGAVFGTPAYMSPEQITAGHEQLDSRTDVWSLGVTLYEGLTHTLPFEAPTRDGLYRAILDGTLPDPRRRDRTVPADLVGILQACLEKDRDRRYQSASRLADDLDAFADGRPVSVKPLSVPSRTLRWARRRPVHAALVVVLLLGVPALAGLLGAYLQGQEDRQRGVQAREEAEFEQLLSRGFDELLAKQPGRGRPHLLEALQRKPDNVEAVAGLALTYLTAPTPELEPQPELALAVLDDRPEFELEHATLRLIRGEALRRLGREDEAAAAEAAAGDARNHVDSFVRAVVALLQADRGARGSYRRAADLAAEAIVASRHARQVFHLVRTRALVRCGTTRERRAAAIAVTYLWPKSDNAWFMRGLLLRGVDTDAAIAAYRRAIAIRPSRGARANIANLHRNQGEPEKALAQFREIIRLEPRYAVGYFNVGAILLENFMEPRQAMQPLLTATELAPRFAEARLLLGRAYYLTGRFQEALTQLRKAVQDGFQRPGFTNDAKRWIKDAEECLAVEPTFAALRAGEAPAVPPKARVALARVASYSGHHVTAAGLFRDAIAADPKRAAALRWEAMCPAACAGCGVGADAQALPAAARERWRRQAHAWVAAILDDLEKSQSRGAKARKVVWHNLLQIRRDPHLVPLQPGRNRSWLTDEERKAWDALWARLDALLARPTDS